MDIGRDRLRLAALFLVAGTVGLAVATGGPDGADAGLPDHPRPPLLEVSHEQPALTGEEPRNVIVISVDTLRADRLGTYGHRRNTSPNIDRFAQDSIVFENAISPTHSTLPAHASLFTGTYLRTHNVDTKRDRLHPGFATIAETYQNAGYGTAAFHGNGYLRAHFGFDQGFEIYEGANETLDDAGRHRHFSQNFPKAVDYLDGHTRNRSFVFVHGYDVHAPYGAPDRFTEFFMPGYDGVADPAYIHRDSPPWGSTAEIRVVNGSRVLNRSGRLIPLDDRDISYIGAAYDAGIRYTDALFGDFIDELKERGSYDDAIIVVLGDHGEHLGGRPRDAGPGPSYLFGHRTLSEKTAHVPLIIHVPGAEPRRISEPVSLVDLVPTLYDLSGLRSSRATEIAGESLVPRITGTEDGSDRVISERLAGDLQDDATMVRGERWTLIRRENTSTELRRLENGTWTAVDPAAFPERTAELRARLEEWRAETPDSFAALVERTRPVWRRIAALLPGPGTGPRTPLNDVLQTRGFEVARDGYRVTRADTEFGLGREMTWLTAAGPDGRRLTIRIVPEATRNVRKDYFESELSAATSIYKDLMPPYGDGPGGRCPEEFRPNRTRNDHDDGVFHTFTMYADGDGQPGACSWDDAVYRRTVKIGYCAASRTAFTVTRLTPAGTERRPLPITCRERAKGL